jgi:hypothetical protein
MAGGAPTKYKKNFHPESVIELMKAGHSVIEVCSKWGIHQEVKNGKTEEKSRSENGSRPGVNRV